MSIRQLFISSLFLLLSQHATARCNAHLFDKQPFIPEASEASIEEMQQANNEAVAYIAKVQKEISCVRDVKRYNAGVKRLNKYAKLYNTQMVLFNSYAGVDEQIDMITISGN
jgi:hypothetical protein